MMRIMKALPLAVMLGLAVCDSGGTAASVLYRRSLQNQPDAVCNDGTAAAAYGNLGAEKQKFVIYLEGGGSCDSPEECKRRCNSGLKTNSLCTAKTAPTMSEFGIVTSLGGPFANWSHVFLPYCTSDKHSGNRPASAATGGYHFRGAAVVLGMIKELKAKAGLGKATDVVLAGSSAGSQGVNRNCHVLASHLPQARVSCVADTNFKDYFSIKPFTSCRTMGVPPWEADAFWNATSTMNPDCQSKIANDKDRFNYFGSNPFPSSPDPPLYLCGYSPVLMRYIKQPYFVGVSQFDKNTLTSECLKGASQAEVEGYFKSWHEHQVRLAQATVLNESYVKGVGYWASSCYVHVQLRLAEYYHEVRVGATKTRYHEALAAWLAGKNVHVWDDCTDKNGLPCNTDCTSSTTCPFSLKACGFKNGLRAQDETSWESVV